MTARQHRRLWTAIAGGLLALPLALRSFAGQFRFTGVAAGNALQSLHTFIDPGVRHQITQTLDEASDEDDEAHASDPKKHFEDQMHRLQRGEEVEQLTVRISSHS